MLKFILILYCLLITAVVLMASTSSDTMIGKGRLQIITTELCANNDNNVFKAEIQRRKVNRTHDGFNATVHLGKVLDDSYGVRIEMSRLVDGGYKLLHVIQGVFIETLKHFADNNTKTFLTMAGVDPPKFPLAAGTLKVTNFIIDFDELPRTGVYGSYIGHILILDILEHIVGCIDIITEFNAVD